MKNVAISGLLATMVLAGCGQTPTTATIQAPASETVKAERSLKPLAVYVKEQIEKQFRFRIGIPEQRSAISNLIVSETPLGHTWTFTCVETVTDFMNGRVKHVNRIVGTFNLVDKRIRIVSTTPILR